MLFLPTLTTAELPAVGGQSLRSQSEETADPTGDLAGDIGAFAGVLDTTISAAVAPQTAPHTSLAAPLPPTTTINDGTSDAKIQQQQPAATATTSASDRAQRQAALAASDVPARQPTPPADESTILRTPAVPQAASADAKSQLVVPEAQPSAQNAVATIPAMNAVEGESAASYVRAHEPGDADRALTRGVSQSKIEAERSSSMAASQSEKGEEEVARPAKMSQPQGLSLTFTDSGAASAEAIERDSGFGRNLAAPPSSSSSSAAASSSAATTHNIHSIATVQFSDAHVSASAQESPEARARTSAQQPAHSQVIRGMQAMLNHHGGSLILRLDPPELGQVRVQLAVHNSNVSVNIQAATQQAHALLREHLPMLTQSLEQHGLSVERLNVHLAGAPTSADDGSSSHRSGNQGQDANDQRSTTGDRDAAEHQSRGQHERDGSERHAREHPGSERNNRAHAFARVLDLSGNDDPLSKGRAA
ncbi:MAG: flagellar hook-length control protein FliK [Phycisphaerales bacterium]